MASAGRLARMMAKRKIINIRNILLKTGIFSQNRMLRRLWCTNMCRLTPIEMAKHEPINIHERSL